MQFRYRTILALQLLKLLQQQPTATRITSKQLSDILHASGNTVAKTLQKLSKVKLVRCTRGPHGGVQLQEPLPKRLITVLHALDDLPMDSCPLHAQVHEECPLCAVSRRENSCISSVALTDVLTHMEDPSAYHSWALARGR